ncbi:MAG: CRISPR-associated endonuclease Cas2 [Xanthomonadales bacterium]|nr:CRISPR-associated endonuclease Cas2 [Xanthomonadales bacterium]
MRNIWIVCYDISNNKRRYRLDKLLSEYGMRIQFSVYETIVSKDGFNALRNKINSIIDIEEDKVNYYRICRWCQDKVILQGKAKIANNHGFTCIC